MDKADSPAERTWYDRTIECLVLAGLLWALYPVIFSGTPNEASVPIHYDITGRIDRSLLAVPFFVALAFYLLLSLLQRVPGAFSYPVRVTEKNEKKLQCIGVQLVRHVKLILVLIFGYLVNNSFAVAAGERTQGLNPVVIWGLMAALVAVLVYFIKKMIRLKDPGA